MSGHGQGRSQDGHSRQKFWVYENWRAQSKAVVHRAECGYCKDGAGCHANPKGEENGRWVGPFAGLDAAKRAAEATGRNVTPCPSCIGE